MSNDVPTKPGYYKDFEGDIWRLEESGSWTLRPETALQKRNAGDFWRYQPMKAIPAPLGLPKVQYQVQVIEVGHALKVFDAETLAQARKFVELYGGDGAEYHILRIEATEMPA